MNVSEKDKIIIVDKNETVRSQDYGFPFYEKGTKYGLIAGVAMGAISLVISFLVGVDTIGWDFLKYIALGLVLGQLLNRYKRYLPEGKVFKDGMLLGMYTSFIAAITMTAIDLFFGLIGIDYGFLQKFGLEADSISSTLVMNGLMTFEGIVFGMILTFIWLQSLKDPQPAE